MRSCEHENAKLARNGRRGCCRQWRGVAARGMGVGVGDAVWRPRARILSDEVRTLTTKNTHTL